MSRRWSALALACCAIVGLVGLGVAAGMWFQARADRTDGPIALSDAEVGFVQDMAAHHEQAILLTQNLSDQVSPHVRVLSEQIELEQMREIGELRGWLRLYALAPQSSSPMAWMAEPGDGGHHGQSRPTEDSAQPVAMPGMASWPDIDDLRGLTGRDAEVRFLQLMIRHHNGGIDMATAGYRASDLPAVRQTALSMVQSQADEIESMTGMLRARGAAALPYP
ncbi:DUF305 domain-containing protein [Rhodococcus sp. NPDC058514]|uniref:DUF305 domain-containing protein n=1 Tax=unclassified Rhodococcus (in: high G+C Gram-positive bacteria) TaxID=192944 RepID=UPI00364B2EB6